MDVVPEYVYRAVMTRPGVDLAPLSCHRLLLGAAQLPPATTCAVHTSKFSDLSLAASMQAAITELTRLTAWARKKSVHSLAGGEGP